MQRARWQAYLFIAPAGVLLLVFWAYPLVDAMFLSLRGGKMATRFVGLQNYYALLTGSEFWHSLGVSVWYVIGTVPVTLVLSFFIANLLFQKLRGLGLYRTIYFLPYVTSTVAAAMVWTWIFGPGQRGIANTVLGWFGVAPQRWMSESAGVFELIGNGLDIDVPGWAAGPSLALVCVMLFGIWHTLGFDIVIFLAGLSAIPKEMYEAAEIDGANTRQRLWHITIPLLSPTLFFLAIISTIRSFQTFNQIYVMTARGNEASTRNLPMLIFSKFYNDMDYGSAVAVAIMLFFILLALTVFQMRVLGARVQY